MPNPVLSQLRKDPGAAGAAQRVELTLDDVVASTGLLLGITVVVGALAALIIPAPTQMPVAAAASFGALAMSLALSFSRLQFNGFAVAAFAVLEGLVLGPVTVMYATAYDGVVTGAVVGTVCGFAGTLVTYKLTGVRVSSKMRRVVTAAMFGFVAVMLVDLALMAFGAGVGFAGFGPLGALMSAVGVALAVFSLLIDFEDVENAVTLGAPAQYRWALGFGLLVSLVWMYTNLLRLLAFFSSD